MDYLGMHMSDNDTKEALVKLTLDVPDKKVYKKVLRK